MVSRFRLMMWRWVSRIHRTLHQAETFYKVPHTTTSDTGQNLWYEVDIT